MFIFLGLLETEINENEKEREGMLIYKKTVQSCVQTWDVASLNSSTSKPPACAAYICELEHKVCVIRKKQNRYNLITYMICLF